MSRCAIALVSTFLLGFSAFAQRVEKLPKVIPGVMTIPNLDKQPTTVVKPVYPAKARERWIQGTVILQVVIGRDGAVETVGCDRYDCMLAPKVLVEAAADAVRKWQWEPLLLNGMPIRVRTRVVVKFVLDETTSPISVCSLISDPQWFDRRTVNVSGAVERVGDLIMLSSSECQGRRVVIADRADGSPLRRDANYSEFEQAIKSHSVNASLRGEFQQDNSIGELGGQRLVLERVLKVSK